MTASVLRVLVAMLGVLLLVSGGSSLFAAEAVLETVRGQVDFVPPASEAQVPPPYRLTAAKFAYELTPQPTVSQSFELFTLTFPSPLVTPEANNNTVHCEFFRAKGAGKRPAVVMLHILGGDFPLSRLFCRSLASHGVSALFVKMPYYGPRRQPGSTARMVSMDPEQTVRGMTQAVLDVRRAAAWLAAQSDIDGEQLGIMGISLGGITGALAATAEPRFQKVCLLLAGGDIGQVAWNAKELAALRKTWTARGGTQESLVELLKPVDPVTYGELVRGRSILMLNASHDEVIPKACTESLWKAFGKPEIVWWDAGHYTAARFIFEGLARATRFFAGEASVAAEAE